MPQFLTMDYFILIIAGGFALYEIYAFISTRGKVLLEGKPYGRTVSGGIITVLFALALWARREALGALWLDAAVVAAALALFFLLKAGLGDAGIYYVGRYYPYKKLQYYQIDRETENGFALRFTNGVKEYVIEYPIEQKQLVVAYMVKAQVPDLMAVKGKK